jgi:lysophospholipase L1-like esterase
MKSMFARLAYTLLALTTAFSARAADREIQRLLYVAAPGIRDYQQFGGQGVLVFDIDQQHRFVRRIDSPAGKEKPANIKGICASVATRRLYETTPTKLYCLDLVTDKPLWEQALPGGCDRMSITPDGQFLYVPSFEKEIWNVVDGASGEVVATVTTNSGAHNTICSLDGQRAFLAGLRSPVLTVVDAHTHKKVKEIGPFSAAIRPFTINDHRTHCFVCVNGLLGFEIGDLVTGKKLGRVEVAGVETGPVKRHGCPSHGIGLSPDERELWLCDGHNSKLHVFDLSADPPKQTHSIALREQPGWVTFSLDGQFAYPSTGEVIDTVSKKIVTALKDEAGREVHSEKMLEVHFQAGKPVRVGDQFGLGRSGTSAVSADVKDWHLLEPIWISPVVYGESVLFIKEGDAAPNARLALRHKRIKQIALANRSQVFTEEDYTVDPATRTLALTGKSKIPFLKSDELYPPKNSPHSYRAKADDPNRWMLFDEAHMFHDLQVEVTYEADEAWTGYRPGVAKDLLPRTLAKLKNGEPLTIAVSGDSISTGDNASGVTGAKPGMPGYPQLVAEQLQASFPGKVTLVNRAVGGWRLEHGLKDLPKLLAAKPDLVIIAYGMNHIRSRDSKKFKQMLGTMIEQIRAADPETEIILVAPMYGNRQWSNTPPEQLPLHRDAIASFVGPKIALCDVTTLWGNLLEHKRDVDLIGNGVNHPNDFGHRLYAQAILGLLMEMPVVGK